MSSRRQERQETRKSQYKKAISSEDSRRKREELTSDLRKVKREDGFLKKRNIDAHVEKEKIPSWTPAHIAQQLALLPQYVTTVMSNDPSGWFQNTVNIRKLLSVERNPPIDQVLKTGCVSRFVQFLTCWDNPKLQFEAAWVLTNIASGNSEHTQAVVNYGAVPVFVQLGCCDNDELKEQAIWALGNIAGDSPRTRDLVLSYGIVDAVLHVLNTSDKSTLVRNATWTLSNLCRGKPQPDFNIVGRSLPTLARLIHSPDEEIVTDALWALSYLSDGTEQNIQAVLNSGVAPKVVSLLKHTAYTIQTPALRTVGNIVTGTDEQTQVMVDLGILPVLFQLLQSPRKAIKKEAAWTVSNITAGNVQQTQQVIGANIIPQLITCLDKGEFDVKREAAWAISNATSWKNPDQVRTIVGAGAIPPMIELLKQKDAKVIIVVLDTLKNILSVGKEMTKKGGNNPYVALIDECEGVETLEELQNHENNEIYKRALQLLENFFGADDEDENLAPAVSHNQFQFSAPSGFQNPGGFVF